MKAKQKQWQLYYLGFLESEADIDGAWGPVSEQGTRLLQEFFGITVDGVFGTHTRNQTKSAISNIQRILRSCAPELEDDGLAGPATVKATKAYQEAHGLPVTGVADDRTWVHFQLEAAPQPQDKPQAGTFWDEIEYFTREELRCKCGGRYCNGFPAEPQGMAVQLADRARKYFGRPAQNVSFLRCATWNAISGGVANSQHMYGEAMDICIPGVSADRLYSFLKQQPEVRYTYKINNTNVHFDIPKGVR